MKLQPIMPARAMQSTSDAQHQPGVLQSAFPFGVTIPQFLHSGVTFQPAPAQGTRGVNSSRSGVCASRHMAAEQRRRARINDRLEALRTLVPHSARSNTAAFLSEVYDYIVSLHKRMEGNSSGESKSLPGIDLNVAATENRLKHSDSVDADSGGCKKRGRDCSGSDDGESDVESEEHNDEAKVDGEEVETRAPSPVASPSPSLFDSAILKQHVTRPADDPQQQGLMSSKAPSHGSRSAFSPLVASASVGASSGLDTGLSMRPPSSSPPRQPNTPPPIAPLSADVAATACPLSSGRATQQRKRAKPREIQPAPTHPPSPAPLPMLQGSASGISQLSILPQMHPSAMVAAAAAVADAAAAAQQWGMAAAMAQAQAQVAAQVHAQAQALVHHVHRGQQQQPQGGGNSYVPVAIPRRRRRGGAAPVESAPRVRQTQTIVRPIAMKPQA